MAHLLNWTNAMAVLRIHFETAFPTDLTTHRYTEKRAGSTETFKLSPDPQFDRQGARHRRAVPEPTRGSTGALRR